MASNNSINASIGTTLTPLATPIHQNYVFVPSLPAPPPSETRPYAVPIHPPVPPLEAVQSPYGLPTPHSLKIVKQEAIELPDIQENPLTTKVWDVLIKHVSDKLETIEDQSHERKFLTLLAQIEEILGEFKCFLDACLQEDIDGFKLGPELCRAYNISMNTSWAIKKPRQIDPVYKQFFVSNLDEKEEFYSDEDEYFDHPVDQSEDIDVKEQDLLTRQENSSFFSCYLCKTTFNSANALLQHKKQHHRYN